MSKLHLKAGTALVALAGALAMGPLACGGEDLELDPAPAPEQRPDQDGVHTLTIVDDGPDGQPVITERAITTAEQRAMIEARRAREAAHGSVGAVAASAADLVVKSSAISQLTDCPNDAVWMFSQPGLTGDQLCYRGKGVTSLDSVCVRWEFSGTPYCVETWKTRVRSLWPGVNAGSLLATSAGRCDDLCVTWPAWGPAQDVSCGTRGAWLELSTWGADQCWLSGGHYSFRSDSPGNEEFDWTNLAQGVAVDDTHWYFTKANRIYKVPRTASLGQDFGGFPNKGIPWAGFTHMGDIDVYKGRIYVPLEGSSRAIGIMDTDLNAVGLFALDAAHAAWCAVNPADGYLYTSSDFDTVTKLSYYNRTTGELLGTRRLTFPDDSNLSYASITRVQGGAFSGKNRLYLVSDARGNHANGGIWGFDLNRSGRAVRTTRIAVNYEERWAPWPYDDEYTGDELEGLAIEDVGTSQLHLMMVDVDSGDDDIYFKHYRIDDVSHL